MKITYIKRIILSLVLLFSLSVTTVYATVTQEQIDQAQQQVNQLQQQVQDAENQVGEITGKKDELESDLKNFNNDLQKLVNDMNELEDEIDVKQDEVAVATTELEAAEKQVQKQYSDMKRRIQYMYENGSYSIMTAIFESNSISDMINQTEHVSAMVAYDRQKLLEFQELQEEVKAKKEVLEEEEEQLLVLQDQMGQKRNQVNTLIANTEKHIDETKTELSNAQMQLDNLEEQLKAWEKYEAELEAQKLAQDLAYWEQIQNAGQEDWSGVAYVPAQGELYLLGAIIQCEAEGEPYLGQLAVGSVVMNRVKSSKFPNTITEVVYQRKQFSPVASGRLAYRLQAGVNNSCMKAATEVLNGTSVTNALFFCTTKLKPNINGTVIGNHVFY